MRGLVVRSITRSISDYNVCIVICRGCLLLHKS